MVFVRSDPKRLAGALTTETEESCTTYNMLKVLQLLLFMFSELLMHFSWLDACYNLRNKACRFRAIYSDGRRKSHTQTTMSERWSTASWASREAGIPVWWSTCFHRAPGDQRQWATTVGEHSLTHSGVAMALVSDTVLCPKTGDENASSDFWIM